MAQKIKQQTYKFKAGILSPVHVGSGETLQKDVDFFVENKKIGKVDSGKILNIIGEEKINWWVEQIEKGKNIWEELKRQSNDLRLEDVSSEMIPFKGKEIDKNELKEFIRNQFSQNPILPGSSIKGAIRTAIITNNLINKYKNEENLYQKITESKGNRDQLLRHDKEILKSIVEIEENQHYSPQNDIFKLIKIRDVEIPPENLFVDNFQTLNLNQKEEWYIKKRLTILVEVVQGEFELEMVVDDRFFIKNKFDIQSITDFIKRINQHTCRLVRRELQAFEDDLDDGFIPPEIGETLIEQLKEILSLTEKENSAVFRMAAGSGWDFMTGAWLKEVASKEEWEEIKKLLARRGYEKFPFPKTRRLLGDYRLPGFVKITLT